MSEPGAAAQNFHRDVAPAVVSRSSMTVSVQVSLVDTAATQGCLEVIPGSQVFSTDVSDRERQESMPKVKVAVPAGKAARIANFYRAAFGAEPVIETIGEGGLQSCTVPIGTASHGQSIIYIDTAATIPPYDGHHLAIYLDDYAGGYQASADNNLIWNNPRFNDMPKVSSHLLPT